MKEARIILPTSFEHPDKKWLEHNEGPRDAESVRVEYVNAIHAKLEYRLAQEFGGYTATVGKGGWVDDQGDLVQDDVIVYDVAGVGSVADENELMYIAQTFRNMAQQDCVYVRFFDGTVRLIGESS